MALEIKWNYCWNQWIVLMAGKIPKSRINFFIIIVNLVFLCILQIMWHIPLFGKQRNHIKNLGIKSRNMILNHVDEDQQLWNPQYTFNLQTCTLKCTNHTVMQKFNESLTAWSEGSPLMLEYRLTSMLSTHTGLLRTPTSFCVGHSSTHIWDKINIPLHNQHITFITLLCLRILNSVIRIMW